MLVQTCMTFSLLCGIQNKKFEVCLNFCSCSESENGHKGTVKKGFKQLQLIQTTSVF